MFDEETLQAIRRQREMGFGWRWDGLGDWTTEAIFAKLRELGVDTDRERFSEQARQARRCFVLYKTWTGDTLRYDLWDDFPLFASEELWIRLTPDLLCPEIAARDLEEVLRSSPRDEERILLAAIPLMDYLESFPPDERAAQYEEVREPLGLKYPVFYGRLL